MDEVFLPHPLGVMMLSAALKQRGDETRLFSIRRHGDISRALEAYQPDIIAYSIMSPSINAARRTDVLVRDWISRRGGKQPLRIMGGPHPTFTPSVLWENGAGRGLRRRRG